jgi:carboxypeptidase C (cathepsin A)
MRFAAALLLTSSIAAAPLHAALPDATVVEYYRAEVDHYFMTASPQEQALLDDGTIRGWARTGVSFFAWTDAARAPATAQPVCRFYGRPEAGLDSHFYSAFPDECTAVQARFPGAWQLESPSLFYIEAPDRTSGACAAGTDPVYRVYDNRTDANHRYMLSADVRATMLSRGWIPEGHGPDAVVMCAPRPATAADDVALDDPAFYWTQPGASLATAVDSAAVTHHQITLQGATIHYTATAGHLVATDPRTGAPQASFFYVAYTADGRSAADRPVTFFYNGGPGSASVWLHLGSFGPKRLATGFPATTAQTPFPLVDNDESLLDTSDLVFVDAVGTGLSEAIAPNTNQSFWSVDKDAAVFRDFITRYLAVNQREASPKYLFGESYGTTRTAVLARLLETAGVALSGIVLQSSVLDYGSNCGVVLATISCAGYLPSYASVGAYFNRVSPPPADLQAFRDGVQALAVAQYAPAVDRWLAARELPAGPLVDILAADTGIAPRLWQSNFNYDPGSFQVQLLPGTLIGRYDARVSVPSGSPLAIEGDPSSTFITPSFTSTIRNYLRTSLKYTYFANYSMLSRAIDYWDFTHDGRQLPDVVPDLGVALALNPGLKVLSVNGFHDLATPYFQTGLDLARLQNATNIRIRNYDGGHMTYLDDGSRPLEKADVQRFYRAGPAFR